MGWPHDVVFVKERQWGTAGMLTCLLACPLSTAVTHAQMQQWAGESGDRGACAAPVPRAQLEYMRFHFLANPKISVLQNQLSCVSNDRFRLKANSNLEVVLLGEVFFFFFFKFLSP